MIFILPNGARLEETREDARTGPSSYVRKLNKQEWSGDYWPTVGVLTSLLLNLDVNITPGSSVLVGPHSSVGWRLQLIITSDKSKIIYL